jgi:hypothetical protein
MKDINDKSENTELNMKKEKLAHLQKELVEKLSENRNNS